MKRVLITGGTGFVGAVLARRLVADGHGVHLLVRPGHARWRLSGVEDSLHLHASDLRDRDGVCRVLRTVRPEWIFHLAVYGAYPTERDVHGMIEANIVGTVNLLEASLEVGFENFINTGSSSEYGYKDHAPPESELPEPNSHYAVTKVSATMLCAFTARSLHSPITTLRLYSVYGPYEEPTRLWPTLVTEGLRGRLPPLVGPDVARDFVHVDDVAEAYIVAARTPAPGAGAVYNVGTGLQTTIRDIVGLVRNRLGIAAEPRWGSLPERSWDTTVWVSDPAMIRHDLGWVARVAPTEGLNRFIKWFEANPNLFSRYEESIHRARRAR